MSQKVNVSEATVKHNALYLQQVTSIFYCNWATQYIFYYSKNTILFFSSNIFHK